MKHVHILGICGTFMGGVAAIAREAGFKVTGSDQNIYPPMSDQLARLGIGLTEGYGAEQLTPEPDVVVVGNVMSRGMPVIEAMLNRRVRYMSGPEWLAEHVLRDRWVIGVSGTHGKTTTTSLVAWLLESAGRKAGFLIGGAPVDFEFSARLGSDPVFVIEADEYDTAFFDKRAKFLLYRPQTLIVNNLEFDHADIYPDLAAITRQFHQLVRAVPGNGRVIVPAADSNVAELLKQGCWTPVDRFASAAVPAADWHALEEPPGRLTVFEQGRQVGATDWQLTGGHNVENALAALLAARHAGVSVPDALQGIGSFRGVQRRLQLLGEFAGVSLFDDFAHHPTAIARTIAGLRRRAGVGRVVAVFEPRSNSMKLGAWKDSLAAAIGTADRALVSEPPGLKWDLRSALAGAANITVAGSLEQIVSDLAASSRPGDAIVVMSNGDFGGLHGRLRDALAQRAGRR